MEIWKEIPENTRYSVSNTGKVRNNKTGRILKDTPDKDGYARVGLWTGEKVLNRIVHRLMAQAFILNPENKKQVNHIDGDKTNNKLTNLEWATDSENIRHAVATGLMVGRKGTKHHNAKLTEDDVREIKRLAKSGMLRRDIAKRFGIAKNHITRITTGTRWGHIE